MTSALRPAKTAVGRPAGNPPFASGLIRQWRGLSRRLPKPGNVISKEGVLSLTALFLKSVLLAGALIYPLAYLVIASSRLAYPYEIHWMEGGHVDHVIRILSGHQLYSEPSLEFTPFEYGPLYFYVSAAVAAVWGVGFFPLRLVSLLASIGCSIILYRFVARSTSSAFCGLLATCFYMATFRISGAAFDIARVDSLFMLFLLGSIYFLRFGADFKSVTLSGILMFCSFLSKQTALLVAVPLSIYCLLAFRGRLRWMFPATLLTLVALTTLIFDWSSGGWYYYYVFDLPKQHDIAKHFIAGFWIDDIAKPLPLLASLAVFHFAHSFEKGVQRESMFFPLLFLGMVGASWFSRMHSGGTPNVLFPAYAALAMYGSLGVSVLLSEARARQRHGYSIMVMSMCILQFGSLYYSPRTQIPSRVGSEAGNRLVDLIKSTEGEVFVPFHGYLSSLARKRQYAHIVGIDDVLRGNNDKVKSKLASEIRGAILNKKFSVIILDSVNPAWFSASVNSAWFAEVIEQNYTRIGSVFNDDGFFPVTGMRTRPDVLYRRKAP